MLYAKTEAPTEQPGCWDHACITIRGVIDMSETSVPSYAGCVWAWAAGFWSLWWDSCLTFYLTFLETMKRFFQVSVFPGLSSTYVFTKEMTKCIFCSDPELRTPRGGCVVVWSRRCPEWLRCCVISYSCSSVWFFSLLFSTMIGGASGPFLPGPWISAPQLLCC